jgi:hypothetical protein
MLSGTCTEVTPQVPSVLVNNSAAREERTHPGGNKGIKVTSDRDSAPIALSRWGDPLVDHALVLLLRGSGYDVRVLPASSLNEPRSLEGTRLLLLTPPKLTLSPLQRESFLTSLRDTIRDARIPVLELTTSSTKTREEARDASWHMVPWPCRIEDLEQRIEAASMEKSLRGPSKTG